jgi:hypothetical protein
MSDCNDSLDLDAAIPELAVNKMSLLKPKGVVSGPQAKRCQGVFRAGDCRSVVTGLPHNMRKQWLPDRT